MLLYFLINIRLIRSHLQSRYSPPAEVDVESLLIFVPYHGIQHDDVSSKEIDVEEGEMGVAANNPIDGSQIVGLKKNS